MRGGRLIHTNTTIYERWVGDISRRICGLSEDAPGWRVHYIYCVELRDSHRYLLTHIEMMDRYCFNNTFCIFIYLLYRLMRPCLPASYLPKARRCSAISRDSKRGWAMGARLRQDINLDILTEHIGELHTTAAMALR